MIKRIAGIYYSPAGGAAAMTRLLAGEIRDMLEDCSPEEIAVECHDLLIEGTDGIAIDEETVVIIGVPVCVGKIPLPAARALRKVGGSGALALVAVSYGGRSYGNALFELNSLAEDCGFRPVGAGAFLIKHMAPKGSRRKKSAFDSDVMSEFVKASSAKIKRLAGCEIEELRIKPAPVEVKGRMPVHKISRVSPKAAAVAQKVLETVSVHRRRSEWFL